MRKVHWNTGRKHSEEHISKTRRPLEKNGRWKGGVIFDKNGYVLIKKCDHPFSDNKGYIREHRLVMESEIGRMLLPSEVVHHKNSIKHDNRPENLELIENQSKHMRIERTGKKFPRKDGGWFKCLKCRAVFYRSAYFKSSRIPKWCSWKCRYNKPAHLILPSPKTSKPNL